MTLEKNGSVLKKKIFFQHRFAELFSGLILQTSRTIKKRLRPWGACTSWTKAINSRLCIIYYFLFKKLWKMPCNSKNFQHIKKIVHSSIDNLILQIPFKFQVDWIKIIWILLLAELKNTVLRKTRLKVWSLPNSPWRLT